jgi:pyrimidine operon attenuation protein/uracil phosphoribosyltransferase
LLVAAHVDAGRVLLDSEALNRTIARIAHEIVEVDEVDRVLLIPEKES